MRNYDNDTNRQIKQNKKTHFPKELPFSSRPDDAVCMTNSEEEHDVAWDAQNTAVFIFILTPNISYLRDTPGKLKPCGHSSMILCLWHSFMHPWECFRSETFVLRYCYVGHHFP